MIHQVKNKKSVTLITGESMGLSVNQFWCGIAISEVEERLHDMAYYTEHFDHVILDDNQARVGIKFEGVPLGRIILFNPKMLPAELWDRSSILMGCQVLCFPLSYKQEAEFERHFAKLANEAISSYRFRKEFVSNLLEEIIHYIIINFTYPSFMATTRN
jgi:hypothetical protein